MNYTLAEPGFARLKVKRSEFLARVAPIGDKGDLDVLVKEMKKNYPRARHICWAGRWMTDTEVSEFNSDAGEPSGTAGLPILNQLRSNKLVNTGCAVARHFGGIKLGKRGLIEAYGEAAARSIQAGKKVAFIPRITLEVTGPYALVGDLSGLLAGFQGKLIEDRSQIDLVWFLSLPVKSMPDFVKRLEEIPGVAYKKTERA